MIVTIKLISTKNSSLESIANRGERIVQGIRGELRTGEPKVGSVVFVLDTHYEYANDYFYRTSPVVSVHAHEDGWTVQTMNSKYEITKG